MTHESMNKTGKQQHGNAKKDVKLTSVVFHACTAELIKALTSSCLGCMYSWLHGAAVEACFVCTAGYTVQQLKHALYVQLVTRCSS